MKLAGWSGVTSRPSVFLLLLLCGASLRAGEAPVAPSPEEPAPLEVFNRHITTLRAGYQGLSPRQRAQRVVQKIENLDYARLADPITCTIANFEGQKVALVTIGNTGILGISEKDLDPASRQTLEQASADAILQLKAALKDLKDARQESDWIKERNMTLAWAAALAAGAAIFVVLRRKIIKKTREGKG